MHPVAKKGLIDYPEELNIKGDTGQGITFITRLNDVNTKILNILKDESEKIQNIV